MQQILLNLREYPGEVPVIVNMVQVTYIADLGERTKIYFGWAASIIVHESLEQIEELLASAID